MYHSRAVPRSRHRKKKPAKVRTGRRYIVDEELGVFSAPEESMSNVMLEFLEPYREFDRDGDMFAKLVGLGTVAWNLALLPEAERSEALEEFAAEMFGSGRLSVVGRCVRWVRTRLGLSHGDHGETEAHRNFKATVEEMIERKLRKFPSNRRFVLDYQIAGDGSEQKLFVISTLERPRI